MEPLSPDNNHETQQIQFELMRQLPGWKRLALAFDLTQALRQLVLADIRYRYPDASDEEVRKRFIARVLPRQDVIRAYGFDPRIEDYGQS